MLIKHMEYVMFRVTGPACGPRFPRPTTTYRKACCRNKARSCRVYNPQRSMTTLARAARMICEAVSRAVMPALAQRASIWIE